MRLLLLIMVVLALSFMTSAQWEQTAGPPGGNVNCLTNTANMMYAGTSNGIFVSSNNGGEWLFSGLKPYKITALVEKDNFIFAGVSAGKIYRSINNGVAWQELVEDFPPIEVSALIEKDEYLFTSFRDNTGQGRGEVYRTSDYGDTWIKLDFPYPGRYRIFDMIIHNTGIFACGVGGIYNSTDNGDTWNKITTLNATPTAIGSVANSIYAGNFYNIYRSIDDGNNWIKLDFPLQYVSTNKIIPVDTIVFVATEEGIYKSSDRGESWKESTNGLTYKSISTLHYFNNMLFSGSFYGGVHISLDKGNNWNVSNTGLYNSYVLSVLKKEGKIYSGTAAGVYVSDDLGDNWYYSGLTAPVNSLLIANEILFAGTWGKGIYKSDDNGNTWQQINAGITESANYISSLLSNSNFIVAGTLDGVFVSSNYGSNWIRSSGFERVYNRKVNALANNANLVFAGTGDYYLNSDGGSIYFSSDNGYNFELTTLDGFYNFKSLGIENEYIWAGSSGLLTCGLYKSADNGLNWDNVSNHLPSGAWCINSILLLDEGILIGTHNGTHLSFDQGNSWTSINAGFPDNISIDALAKDNTYLFAGSNGYGLWRTKLIVPSTDESELPLKYVIYQNFPNPFNPTTIIKFQITEFEFVTLKVYDVLGHEIATLVSEEKSAGNYEVEFDATDLTSGIYFYRIQAGRFSSVKKLVLLK